MYKLNTRKESKVKEKKEIWAIARAGDPTIDRVGIFRYDMSSAKVLSRWINEIDR